MEADENRQADDVAKWKEERDTRHAFNRMWEADAAETKSRRCCPTEARELLAMLPGRAVPDLFPYSRRLENEMAIKPTRHWVKRARLCRDEAIVRAEVIRLVASGEESIGSAAIRLGIESTSLEGAERKATDYWKSRVSPPAEPGADWKARDRKFQLEACRSARKNAIDFIDHMVDIMWLRWMDEPDRILCKEFRALVQKYDIGDARVRSRLRLRDRPTEWFGRGMAEWDRPGMSVILAGLSAVDTFATIAGRIAPNYDRVTYGLDCADEYFRGRREPRPPPRPRGHFGEAGDLVEKTVSRESLALWMPRLHTDVTPEDVDKEEDLPNPYVPPKPKRCIIGIQMLPRSI